MEKVKYNSKSKSGYFNDDTLEHFTQVAIKEGWDQMTRDAWEFVSVDCEWEYESDRDHIVRVLINEVGSELLRFIQP